MNPIFSVILGALSVGYPALFAWAAFARTGTMKPKSRADLVTTLADALLTLVLARLLFDWTLVWPVLWMLPVALMAAGVTGVVRRWTQLNPWREGRPVRRSQLFAGLHLLVVVAIIATVLIGSAA